MSSQPDGPKGHNCQGSHREVLGEALKLLLDLARGEISHKEAGSERTCVTGLVRQLSGVADDQSPNSLTRPG